MSESSGPPPVPLWMVTFSDTTGLLVCFFVLIIGFSSMDIEAMDPAPGLLSGYTGVMGSERKDKNALLANRTLASSSLSTSGYDTVPDYDPLSFVKVGFDTRMRASVATNILEHRLTDEGFEISLLPSSVFLENSAEFKPGADEALAVVEDAFRYLPHPVQVLAHADADFLPRENTPTPEELALQRAVALCQHLRRKGNVASDRIILTTNCDEEILGGTRRRQATITILRTQPRRSR